MVSRADLLPCCGILSCYSLYMDTREALRNLDFCRGEWWLCKRDSDAEWTLTADPYAPKWDWRIRVGRNKSRAVNRLRASEQTAYRNTLDLEKLTQARQIVDMLRSASQGSCFT